MPSDETTPEPLITVGKSPRNAWTGPDGMRFYRWRSHELPSVTTIQRMSGIAHRLHGWIISEVSNHAINHAREYADRVDAVADLDQLRAISAVIRHELWAAGSAKRDEAAALGTAVHEAVAADLGPDDVPADVQPRLAQYRDWERASGARVLASEFQIWNLTVGYAGTADLLVEFRDGSRWLVDIKTGVELSEHALQLVAYLMGEFVGNDGVVDEAATKLLHSATGMAVLHLANDGWEFQAIRSDSSVWDAFRGLVTFATWMRSHEKSADVVIGSRKGKVKLEDVVALRDSDPLAIPA